MTTTFWHQLWAQASSAQVVSALLGAADAAPVTSLRCLPSGISDDTLAGLWKALKSDVVTAERLVRTATTPQVVHWVATHDRRKAVRAAVAASKVVSLETLVVCRETVSVSEAQWRRASERATPAEIVAAVDGGAPPAMVVAALPFDEALFAARIAPATGTGSDRTAQQWAFAVAGRRDLDQASDTLLAAIVDVPLADRAVVGNGWCDLGARPAVLDLLVAAAADDDPLARALAARTDLPGDVYDRLRCGAAGPVLASNPAVPDDVVAAVAGPGLAAAAGRLARGRFGDDPVAWRILVTVGATWVGTAGALVDAVACLVDVQPVPSRAVGVASQPARTP